LIMNVFIPLLIISFLPENKHYTKLYSRIIPPDHKTVPFIKSLFVESFFTTFSADHGDADF